MGEYAKRAMALSLGFVGSRSAVSETVERTAQRVRETEEKIGQTDRLIASLSEVYHGVGDRRFEPEYPSWERKRGAVSCTRGGANRIDPA